MLTFHWGLSHSCETATKHVKMKCRQTPAAVGQGLLGQQLGSGHIHVSIDITPQNLLLLTSSAHRAASQDQGVMRVMTETVAVLNGLDTVIRR